MILVTDGIGFLGAHLVKRLAAAGERVRLLVPKGAALPGLGDLGVELYPAALQDQDSLGEAIAGVDRVIHLAGRFGAGKGVVGPEAHVAGIRNLLAAATKAGIERFVYLSIIGARPDPSFPFLSGRWREEVAIRESGLPFTILRSSVIFGEGDRFISSLARVVHRLPLVPLVGGRARLQPVWVGDVASCILKALTESDLAWRAVPVAGPEAFTLEEIVRLISGMLGLKRFLLRLPSFSVSLFQGSFLAPDLLDLLRSEALVEPDCLKKTFGFQPMPLSEGLEYLLHPRQTGRTGGRPVASNPARQKG